MTIKLGLVGKNGAGKSAVCTYLLEHGFTCFSLSNIVRDEANRKGLDLTRDNLVSTANTLKQEKGAAFLAIQSNEKAIGNKIVFDSIRNVEEVNYLKNKNVILIGIDAPIELRYQRIQQRAHGTDHVDFETFKIQDERENSGNSSGQNINAALEHCTYHFENIGDLTTLQQQVQEILNQCQD